jgi:hypothetical protein
MFLLPPLIILGVALFHFLYARTTRGQARAAAMRKKYGIASPSKTAPPKTSAEPKPPRLQAPKSSTAGKAEEETGKQSPETGNRT